MSEIKSNRYLALDVLRGMTVAGMIVVNNPGSWGHIFPPLRHAPWVGCTPTDLVFPFFLFVVGAAMAFSFAKYEERLNCNSVMKLLKRGLLIFLVGLGLNLFPFYPTSCKSDLSFGENYIYWLEHVRIFGVLQRIAMCYVLGGLIVLWLKSQKKISIALILLLALHTLILWAFGGEGWSTLEGNISGKIDIALIGENHVYKGYGAPFDPEGLLGAISGAGTVLLGYLIGQIIRKTPEKINAVAKLYTIGIISLGVGCVLSIWLPICKALWTGSYVFYAGGWAIVMLSFFIYFIDIKRVEKPFFPFKALGMNPLFIFVMAGVVSRTFRSIVKWDDTNALSWFYQNCCVSIFGNNEYASLMYAIVFVAVFLAMAVWLYKKKIFIKL